MKTLKELISIIGNVPTKSKVNEKGQTVELYYKDITNKIIHVGDILEIKSLIGGYGRTKTFVGKFLSSNDFGTWCLECDGVKEYVSTSSDLDFDLLFQNEYSKIMVFNMSTKHGFGSMDVHAHNTYVKILED